MKKITTVSIGIPVYNESKNIGKLLSCLLSQNEEGFVLKEVIIITDGCTDSTIDKIKKIKNKKINLISETERLGKSARLNQIFKLFSGDILFLCDGDIEILDVNLLSKIIKNTNFHNAGLTGVNARPLTSSTFFQRILYIGYEISEQISRKWNDGRNYLSFRGCFLGLDKKFAKQITFDKGIVSNDAYLYLKAIELGYSPIYQKNAVVYFKSPDNFKDHLKQSKRFINSKKEMEQLFRRDLDNEYHIPTKIYLSVLSKALIIKHIYLIYYLFIQILVVLRKDKFNNPKWNIALSTK